MSSKTIGLIVAIVGVLVGLFFVLADVTGVGASPGRFGTRQIIGTAAGALIFIVGVVVYMRQRQA